MKAVGRHSMGTVMPHSTPKALMASATGAPGGNQTLGDEHRVGRAHQVAQQRGQGDGQGDGGHPPVQLPARRRGRPDSPSARPICRR